MTGSWCLLVLYVWVACPGTHPWQKSLSFCIKHECISYICLCANTCTVKQCKACVPFETLVLEKKIKKSLQTLSFLVQVNFLRRRLGKSWTCSAVTRSSVGSCQVCLEKSWSLNSAGCVSLAESSLSCSWGPGVIRFPSSEQGVPKGSQLCFRCSQCVPWPRWLLSGLRGFAAAVVQLSGLPVTPSSLEHWENPRLYLL